MHDETVAEIIYNICDEHADLILGFLLEVRVLRLDRHEAPTNLIRSVSQLVDNPAEFTCDPKLHSDIRRGVIRLMIKLAHRSNRLPRTLQMAGIRDVTQEPVGQGGFADILRGRWNGSLVALKRLRVFSDLSTRAQVERVSACSCAMPRGWWH
jgi:hypothetical protein